MSVVLLIMGGFLLAAAAIVRWRRRRVGRQPERAGILGPHFYWDLIRLARGGRACQLRVAYALFLLGAMLLVYAGKVHDYNLARVLFDAGPTLSTNQTARFAESFVTAILTLQIVAVFVLTPAYIGGAIADEREGKTLELLFTTHLSDREIVLGKLFARLVHLGGILLTGLPILTLTLLFGGVDLELLLAGFGLCLAALLGVGSLSIMVSAQAESTTTALIASYLFALFALAMCMCLGFAAPGSQGLGFLDIGLNWQTALVFAIFALIMIAIFVQSAIAMVRSSTSLPDSTEVREYRRLTAEAHRRQTEQRNVPRYPDACDPLIAASSPRRTALPPIGGNALLWKELNFAGRRDVQEQFRVGLLAGPLLLALLFVPGLFVTHAGQLFLLPRLLLPGIGCVICVGVAFRTAGAVIRERHARTLEGLLTLPVTEREILFSKWLGSILRWRFYLGAFGSILLCGLVSTAFHPLGAILFATLFCLHLTFLASLGIWLSTSMRTPGWTNMAMGVLLLVFFGSSFWALEAGLAQRWGWWNHVLEVGVNPLGSWWYWTFSWFEVEADFWPKLSASLAGAAAYALLGAACWFAALRRLRSWRQGRRDR